jgi:hypothetical protein
MFMDSNRFGCGCPAGQRWFGKDTHRALFGTRDACAKAIEQFTAHSPGIGRRVTGGCRACLQFGVADQQAEQAALGIEQDFIA